MRPRRLSKAEYQISETAFESLDRLLCWFTTSSTSGYRWRYFNGILRPLNLKNPLANEGYTETFTLELLDYISHSNDDGCLYTYNSAIGHYVMVALGRAAIFLSLICHHVK